MQESSVDVSILLLSWNDASYLPGYFDSLLLHTGPTTPSYEVILCDNGTNDPLLETIVKKYSERIKIQFLKHPQNDIVLTMNRLTPLARGKYIMFSAPDGIFLSDVLKELTLFLDTHADAGAVCAKFYNKDGTFHNRYKKFLSLFSIMFGGQLYLGKRWAGKFYHRMLKLKEEPQHPVLIDQCPHLAFLCRREALHFPDVVDRNIASAACDYDMCKSMYERGYVIYLVPSAKIIHFRGVASGLWESDVAKERHILGTLHYFKKHHPWKFYPLKLIMAIDEIVLLMKNRTKRRFLTQILHV